MRLVISVIAPVAFSLGSCAATLPPPPPADAGPQLDVPVERVGAVNTSELNELSGLVASAAYPDVLWGHNDSGAEPVLFPLNQDFEVISPERARTGCKRERAGVTVEQATLTDWETITRIGERLYIGDIGNNRNSRRDLGFWEIPEPNPTAARAVSAARFLAVHYPEQTSFPGEVWEWDAEAAFADSGRLYVLTKHRRAGQPDTFVAGTRLYRFDPEQAGRASTPLELISRRDDITAVTGAALSPDGQLLAVLTYGAVWVFPRPQQGDDWMAGPPWIRALPILRTRQAEAIAWRDAATLVLANEAGQFFRLTLDRDAMRKRAAAKPDA